MLETLTPDSELISQGKDHTRSDLPYVVVFIPAYNEEEMLPNVIKKVQDLYGGKTHRGYWTDIIVINDGSTDRTAAKAKEAGVAAIVSHPQNRGLGAASRTAIQRAYEMGADVVVKIDADFQHDPEDIDKVIQPILKDEADAVFGSRFKGGLQYKMPLYRAWGNRFFSWLVSLSTGLNVTDGQTGLMAFHRRYMAKMDLVSDYNETQQLIMDAWGKHFRVIEVPVLFHKRTTGKSFISFKYPFRVIPTILRMLIRGNPLKVFFRTGLLFITLGIITGLEVLFSQPTYFGDTTVSLLILVGVQLILFGFLADAIKRR